MKVIIIPAIRHGIKPGSNIERYLINGHQVGQLSLSNLRGAARHYINTYNDARDSALNIAALYGVDGYELIRTPAYNRPVRVWSMDGEPVRLELS